MRLTHVAVATITRAQSPAEERLLRRGLELLSNAGLPVAVADAGASAAFADGLAEIPGLHTTEPRGEGLVAQVRASVELAGSFGRPFILYVEPDKAQFFEHRLHAFLEQAPEAHDVGIVLASRSPGSFGTFPPMQRYTEGVINTLCGDLLGVPGDYSYGPFLMNRTLLPGVAALEARLGWGWRHRTFLDAHRRGLRLVHLTGDHPCPPDQRDEDEVARAHRLRQLSQNVLGLVE